MKLLSDALVSNDDFFVEQVHLTAIVFDNTDDVTLWATTFRDDDDHFFHLGLPFQALDTLLRVAVLVGVGAVLWVVGLRGLLWAVAAVAIAAALSYLLLTGPREAVLARWSGEPGAPGDPGGPGARRRGLTDEEAEDARDERA